MSWKRVNNPKPPSARSVKPTQVRVCSMAAAKLSRYIRIKIGSELARRGSFTQAEHKCHLLRGEGDEAGQIAVSVDDRDGSFVAKRRSDGRYEIAVGQVACNGTFVLDFPQFDREGGVVPMANAPAFITFDASPLFGREAAK